MRLEKEILHTNSIEDQDFLIIIVIDQVSINGIVLSESYENEHIFNNPIPHPN